MSRPGTQFPTLSASHRTTWPILLGAFGASPLFYVGLAWFLRRGTTVTPTLPDTLRFALLGAAALAFVAAFAWTRLRLSGSAVPGDATTRFIAPDQFQTAMVVACALAEAPAVLGFVMAVLGGPLLDLYLLAGSSLALIGGVVAPAVLRYLATFRVDGPIGPGS